MIYIKNYIKECNYDDIVKLFLEQALNDDNWEEREGEDGPYYCLEGKFKVPNSDLVFKYLAEKDNNSEHYAVGIQIYIGEYMLDEESYSWSDAYSFYSGAKYYYSLILTRWFHPMDVFEGMRWFEIEEKEKNENA